jgi:hypothetical protein
MVQSVACASFAALQELLPAASRPQAEAALAQRGST